MPGGGAPFDPLHYRWPAGTARSNEGHAPPSVPSHAVMVRPEEEATNWHLENERAGELPLSSQHQVGPGGHGEGGGTKSAVAALKFPGLNSELFIRALLALSLCHIQHYIHKTHLLLKALPSQCPSRTQPGT